MKKILYILIFILLIIPTQVFALSVECPNAILIDGDTGRVLFEQNAYDKAYPASTTKIMTAILALENTKLTDYVTATYNAVMSVPLGGSNTAIQVGEALTVEELLQCLLIASGNDAANILAEHIGGSTESFATMMNTRAQELGCKNTNFLNANGLHDENHYSTAYDLTLLYNYAWNEFPKFREIVGKERFRLPITEKYKDDDRIFVNSNRLIITTADRHNKNYYYEYTTGGKTGYTKEAKNCLVASASKNGFNLVLAVLGGKQDEDGNSYRFMDAKEIFEYGFANLSKETIAKQGDIIKTIKLKEAPEENNILKLSLASPLNLTIDLKDVTTKFEPTITLKEDIKLPIKKGDILGTATYTIYDKDYKIDLVSENNIDVKKVNVGSVIGNIFKTIFIILLILVILILGIRFYNKVIRKNKKKRLFNVNRYNSRFH